jgi:hypothetical protein
LALVLGACAEPGTPVSRGTAARSSSGPTDPPDNGRAPGFTQGAVAPASPSTVQLEQHARALAQRLPAGFTVVTAPPFVVAGDEPAAMVRSRAETTVRWAVERLRQDFFDAQPSKILEVMLFKDEDSYRRNALALYGDEPTTPYGYYSAEHRALIMNIATGGGTLVHEIVHPFVEADFPGCPPWLNEGLGSLFEQSSERDGRIVGATNWRLEGLQRAIRKKRVPRFEELAAADADTFYHRDRGTNYAQARYLLYYLQEHGLLVRFYKEARAARARDPSGYHTLQSVLAEQDMDAFQARWQAWVLRLRFPG